MSERVRTTDRVLWTVLAASVVVALLTLLATQLIPSPDVPRGPGPSLPRMRMPPRPLGTGELMRAMGIGSLTWYACILSAPLFVLLSRLLPFDRRRWFVSLATYVLVIAALVTLTALVQYRLSYGGSPFAPTLQIYLRAALLTGSLPFVVVAAAAQALEARTRARDRELEAVRMQSQLAEARLEALTAQLQPHFLFNTLQAISTLISHDPAAADRMLTSLSDLLREVLRRGEREVTLEEELRVLEPYLDISRWRFGERLSVEIMADPEARRALVPFFVLQPLVENALHHGVGSRAGAGSVRIRAERAQQRLLLTVADDGKGDGAPTGRGIGLRNTRARLQEMYGGAHQLQLGPGRDGGFEVRLSIPYRAGSEPPS